MRRLVVLVAATAMLAGMLGVTPANAVHCDPANLTGCQPPINLIVLEGIGNVCAKAGGTLRDTSIPKKCSFEMNDPTWTTKPASPWNPAPAQGLYWPGIGPGAIGPYVLDISDTPSPPANLCAASVGGAGCKIHNEGVLTAGDRLDTAVKHTGAHCGSSRGTGTYEFVSADNTLKQVGDVEWDQSIATILPNTGVVTKQTNPKTGKTIPGKPAIIGYVSARGVGGSGNCGITEATTGFQVEGFLLTY